ncbi:hypothetical protein SNEBB_010577 [Seison nebaliae]|nr:hypothetical protein SNEBB_010577 [Seison nebaliae]
MSKNKTKVKNVESKIMYPNDVSVEVEKRAINNVVFMEEGRSPKQMKYGKHEFKSNKLNNHTVRKKNNIKHNGNFNSSLTSSKVFSGNQLGSSRMLKRSSRRSNNRSAMPSNMESVNVNDLYKTSQYARRNNFHETLPPINATKIPMRIINDKYKMDFSTSYNDHYSDPLSQFQYQIYQEKEIAREKLDMPVRVDRSEISEHILPLSSRLYEKYNEENSNNNFYYQQQQQQQQLHALPYQKTKNKFDDLSIGTSEHVSIADNHSHFNQSMTSMNQAQNNYIAIPNHHNQNMISPRSTVNGNDQSYNYNYTQQQQQQLQSNSKSSVTSLPKINGATANGLNIDRPINFLNNSQIFDNQQTTSLHSLQRANVDLHSILANEEKFKSNSYDHMGHRYDQTSSSNNSQQSASSQLPSYRPKTRNSRITNQTYSTRT